MEWYEALVFLLGMILFFMALGIPVARFGLEIGFDRVDDASVTHHDYAPTGMRLADVLESGKHARQHMVVCFIRGR